MALSMDEQRMLAEIERRLAADNPGLASDLTSFRKPGRLSVVRSTRARVIGSLFTVTVVAMVSLMVYAMLPFRSGGRAAGHHPVTTTSTSSGPDQAKIGAAPGRGAASSSTASSSTASSSTASRSTASRSTAQAGTGSSASAQPPAGSGRAPSAVPSGRAASTSPAGP